MRAAFDFGLQTIIVKDVKQNISIKKRKRHEYDDYMNCFLANYSMRPSCFNCPVKCGKSMADITIADLWGISKIDPKMDDDKGTSAIIIWRERGFLAINHLAIETEKVDLTGLNWRKQSRYVLLKDDREIIGSADKLCFRVILYK